MAMVHRSRFARYQHAFVPFDPSRRHVLPVSPWFYLSVLDKTERIPHAQFAAGLYVKHDYLVVTYGVADCTSLETRINISTLERSKVWK